MVLQQILDIDLAAPLELDDRVSVGPCDPQDRLFARTELSIILAVTEDFHELAGIGQVVIDPGAAQDLSEIELVSLVEVQLGAELSARLHQERFATIAR